MESEEAVLLYADLTLESSPEHLHAFMRYMFADYW